MATKINPPTEKTNNKTTTRVLGAIMTDPVQATSKSGNTLYRFKILVDDGCGNSTWWNATIMENLASKIAPLFGEKGLSKFAYAKWVGLGEAGRKFTGKDGEEKSSNDILITGVETQDRQFVKADKDEENPPF